jgi:hypothetical protein
MRLKIVLMVAAVLLAGGAVWGQPVLFPTPLSPRLANYDIGVKLDPKTRGLAGHETLVWKNGTNAPATDLQFHLYLNAFRNSKSTFIAEEGAKKVEKEVKEKGWGFTQIDRIALAGGEDLTPTLTFIHPDDDNADDRTVARVVLPQPIAPGATVTVTIDFTARLPEPPVARTGCKGEFCFAGQWFPKVGVFEDGKWNCHQFHASSEFYADFGVYNVRITVPAADIVGSTGVLVERTDNGDGTATHWYHAEDVHDFAWTASPHFVEFTGHEKNVEIRVLMHREHAAQGERHLEAARLGVKYFNEWYGEYPYPNLTVIDPHKGASGAGGMEYPTLITAGTIVGMPAGVHAVEMVIIHEFGHNYWYGLVASNEFEEAWLDEGINTYSEIRIMHDLYEPKSSMIDFLGIKGDDLQARRYGYVKNADYDPLVRPAWQFYSGSSYGGNSYDKTAMMLLTLDNYLGPDVMARLMRTYFERFKFKHPHTRDFIATANEVSGQDLDWFFNQALFDKVILDYEVSRVSSEEIKPGKGYDYTLSAPEGVKREPEKGGPEKVYDNKVRVRRLGDFKFPVTVEVEFADGATVREHWDGRDAWVEYRYVKPVKLKQAKVDPDQLVPLDRNWKNNTLTFKKAKSAGGIHGGYLEMIKWMLNPG